MTKRASAAQLERQNSPRDESTQRTTTTQMYKKAHGAVGQVARKGRANKVSRISHHTLFLYCFFFFVVEARKQDMGRGNRNGRGYRVPESIFYRQFNKAYHINTTGSHSKLGI